MGRRFLRISSSQFVNMFSAGRHDGYEVVADPLPPDTCLINVDVGIRQVRNGGDVCILLESEEWVDGPEGERIPEIKPKFKRIMVWEG